MGFIEDTPSFPTKSDRSPLGVGDNADEFFRAADYAQLTAALLDVRTAIIDLVGRVENLETDVSDIQDNLAILNSDNLFNGVTSSTFTGANENAYAGFATNDVALITVSSNTLLNAMTGGVDGRVVILIHVGSANSINIINDSAGAANDRFITPGGHGTYTMGPGSGCVLRYTVIAGDGKWYILTRF